MLAPKNLKSWMLPFVCVGGFASVPTADPCQTKLPESLREILISKFPGHRLVRVSDYHKEDIDQHQQANKGDPCLGVASADVDGDGFLDFAFFMTNKAGNTWLIAARNVMGRTWEINKLKNFRSSVSSSYVESIQHGSYQDLYDTDRSPGEYTPEPGGVKRFKAIHPGFLAGTIESSGVAFFFTGKRWVHLWLSD